MFERQRLFILYTLATAPSCKYLSSSEMNLPIDVIILLSIRNLNLCAKLFYF